MTIIQKALLRNMKEGRKVLGYSQMKLAELCGVSTSFIGEIEIGRKFPVGVHAAKNLQSAQHETL